jgi:splicing factor 3A subunit 1
MYVFHHPWVPHQLTRAIHMRIYTLATVDRTIVHMNRSSDPLQFEVKLRESRRTDPAFSFLNPADPYHAYYRNRMDAAMRGEILEGVPLEADGKAAEEVDGKISEDYGKPPPPSEFLLDMPNISAVDLYALVFYTSSILMTNILQ